jgi:hypothetical protein
VDAAAVAADATATVIVTTIQTRAFSCLESNR